MPASSVGIPQFTLPIPGKSAVQIGIGLALGVAAYGFYVKVRCHWSSRSRSQGPSRQRIERGPAADASRAAGARARAEHQGLAGEELGRRRRAGSGERGGAVDERGGRRPARGFHGLALPYEVALLLAPDGNGGGVGRQGGTHRRGGQAAPQTRRLAEGQRRCQEHRRWLLTARGNGREQSLSGTSVEERVESAVVLILRNGGQHCRIGGISHSSPRRRPARWQHRVLESSTCRNKRKGRLRPGAQW